MSTTLYQNADLSYDARYPLWSRAVVGEMLPRTPTPLSWSAFWQPCAAEGTRDTFLQRFGFDEFDLPTSASVLALVDETAYLNASLLRAWSSRMPDATSDLADRLIGTPGSELPPHDSDAASLDPISRGMADQWYQWVNGSANQRELRADQALAQAAHAQRPNLASLTDAELAARAFSFQPLARRLFGQHINQTLASTIGPAAIAQACVDVGQPAHVLRLLGGLGAVDSVSFPSAMWELSRMVTRSESLFRFFEQDSSDVLEILRYSTQPEAVGLLAAVETIAGEVGFRGPDEWELASETWGDRVESLVTVLDRLRKAPAGSSLADRRSRAETDRARLANEIADALSPANRSLFLQGIKTAGTFARGRELSRSNAVRVLHEMRLPLRELGRRGAERGELHNMSHIWMLRADEVSYYADGGLADAGEIAAERFEAQTPPPPAVPDLLVATEYDVTYLAKPKAVDSLAAEQLQPGDLMLGVPGSSGMASGSARVVTSMADCESIEPHDLLVLDFPELVTAPFFSMAAGVVSQRGRMNSHAVVVARELGTPMVVGLDGLMSRVTTGMQLNIDGLAGVVSAA